MIDTKWLSGDELSTLGICQPYEACDCHKVERLFLQRIATEREKNAELEETIRELNREIITLEQTLLDEKLRCDIVQAKLAKLREENAAFRERMLRVARDADAKNAELEMQLDEAIKWIRVVGEEFVMAGFPCGDRTVQLANLRRLLNP